MNVAQSRTPPGPLQAEALQALREAAWGVIQEHKRLGMPLIQWRDGQVVEVSPEQAEADFLAAKAQAEAKAPDLRPERAAS
jgi:hypothetical protein